MSDMRHKQQKDENFPVASFLLGKENRKIVTAYYNFARYGDDIADNPDLSEALDEMHRRVVQESIRVAAARTARGVAGPRGKTQEKGSRAARLVRRRLKGAQG